MAKRAAPLLCFLPLMLSALCVSADGSIYTIREGETLFGISKKIKIPLDVICEFNGIDDPGRLRAGTQIRFPKSYAVKKGDTLYSIARNFSVPLQKLMSLNGLRDASQLKAGATLFIPVASDTYATAESGGSGASSGRPSDASRNGNVWPHPGRHEPFQGKISGLVFFGNEGDGVVSASGGEVKWVGPYWGLGKTLIIKNGDGLVFIYAGNEELLVNVGDRVRPGMEIAKLGVSPQGGGAKLYFCIEAEGKFMDPERFFSKI